MSDKTVDLAWETGQPPRSLLYGDLYFSRDDGLAEARAVFLAGCGLPEAWQGRRRFTVGELGFGCGLNILALLDLWRRDRAPAARLHIFSIEAHLLGRDQAARALAPWPELADLASSLLRQWPPVTSGFHRLDFPEAGATLDLAVMEVGDALRAWTGRADAWLLDGFSPALNPAMWRAEALSAVAARTAPGGRLATYTVASAVRRDLAAAGFQVERKPGFGRKRGRLEARLPSDRAAEDRPPRVAIIGAGIAGAALARALSAAGVRARVFATPGPNTSSAPAALVAPRLDAGLGPTAALFAQAFRRAMTLYRDVPGGVIASGAVHLAQTDKDANRFATIAASELFDPATTRLETPTRLTFDDALVVEPSRVLAAWAPDVVAKSVMVLLFEGGLWRLLDRDGALIHEAEVVIVAAGYAARKLLPSVTLRPVRGQASLASGDAPATAALFGGYAVATRNGVMFGATHDRDDEALNERPDDHARNLASLAAALPETAERLAQAPFTAHVGIRATTHDFLPLAGSVAEEAPKIYILSGLGSRGYCLAPLLAEHIAALVTGGPSPLPADLADLVDPSRFARRALKRGRPPKA